MKIFVILSVLCVTFLGCATSSKLMSEGKVPGAGDVKAKKYYTCPMHPEVHESKSGGCPKCGMNLIEETNNNESMNNALLQSLDPKLKTSYVCMMNNKHFGVEQIPVEVEGKMYYGCCQGCVTSLKSNRSIRYTQDPHTGEEVDKADAYIVLNPNNPQSVLYFKSAENYMKYMERSK